MKGECKEKFSLSACRPGERGHTVHAGLFDSPLIRTPRMNCVYDLVVNSAKMYELTVGVPALPCALGDWRQGLCPQCIPQVSVRSKI